MGGDNCGPRWLTMIHESFLVVWRNKTCQGLGYELSLCAFDDIMIMTRTHSFNIFPHVQCIKPKAPSLMFGKIPSLPYVSLFTNLHLLGTEYNFAQSHDRVNAHWFYHCVKELTGAEFDRSQLTDVVAWTSIDPRI